MQSLCMFIRKLECCQRQLDVLFRVSASRALPNRVLYLFVFFFLNYFYRKFALYMQ